jgi:hypothetical protein
MIDRTPYTYLIGWKHLNLWYFGVRYAKNCHPSELWKKYKTSSKKVLEQVKLSGNPDVIEVRDIFDCVEKARNHEHKVLKKLGVIRSSKWLNETDNKSFSIEASRKASLSDISRLRKSNSHIGKPGPNRGRKFSEETKMKMSLARKGKKRPEHSEKMRKAQKDGGFHKGFLHTLETRQKMSNSRLNYCASKQLNN